MDREQTLVTLATSVRPEAASRDEDSLVLLPTAGANCCGIREKADQGLVAYGYIKCVCKSL